VYQQAIPPPASRRRPAQVGEGSGTGVEAADAAQAASSRAGIQRGDMTILSVGNGWNGNDGPARRYRRA
jgi:hypothetical protein